MTENSRQRPSSSRYSSQRDSRSPSYRGEREPPWWVLATGVPTTMLPADVMRLMSKSSVTSDADAPAGRSSRRETNSIARLVTEVRPVYLTASLAPSNQYLFKLADPKYAYTVRDALEGKIVGGGRPLRARFIESSEATKMCQMRVADITLSAPSIRRPNRAAILGETTPSPAGRNTETIDRGWLPMDRSHYGAFVEAIIAQSPGRVALLRGVPYTLSPDILMRRLQRAYKLADPSESRLRWFDERRREWTQVEVEPVMRIHTSSNRFQQVDGSPRDGAAVYLVRFANALDAQRLYRRFHRKIWDQSSRSFSFGAHTRRMAERNHARRQHGDEASAKEESGESAEPYFDPWEQDEGLFRPPGQSERDATGDEDGQLVAPPSRLQPGEVGMDHRRFSIDVQIMY